MSMLTVNLKDQSDTDYLKLLDDLIEKSKKDFENSNRSEYFRKLILKEAKRAGLL